MNKYKKKRLFSVLARCVRALQKPYFYYPESMRSYPPLKVVERAVPAAMRKIVAISIQGLASLSVLR